MATNQAQPPGSPREMFSLLVAEKRKRDDANAAVRQAIADLRLLKEERDAVNREVAELKQARNTSRTEGRELLKQARELRDAMKGIDLPKGSAAGLAKMIDELDFKYQTQPVPFSEEKRLVAKIEELKRLWRVRRAAEAKRKNISNLSGKVDDLFSSSDELHRALLQKAEKSKQLHEAVIEKIRTIDALRAKSNEAHALVIKYSKALGDARELENEERVQRRAEQVLSQEKLLKERAKEVKSRVETTIKSGKRKFDLRDLQILGAAGHDLTFDGVHGRDGKGE